MNGLQKTSTTSASAGVVVSLADLERAVDQAFVDLEHCRATLDQADAQLTAARATALEARSALVKAEIHRQRELRDYWKQSAALNDALGAMHATRRAAAGGAP